MSKAPTVAIVGRPNVGKSTLFNRLTGTRGALVSDVPGLTRDRREGTATLGGHAVTMVDTAGFEDARPGSIGERMRRQTETAIEGADLVLFVVDVRDGLTATDEDLARLVRTSGRPLILVANKSESRKAEEVLYDFFKLGLGDPVAISAEHGLGLGALERDAIAALGLKPERRLPERDREEAGAAPSGTELPLRLAIVGRPNTGKSTLVNALLGEERMITGPEPGLTRDAVASELDWGQRRIRIVDTAGLRRKAKVTDLAERLSASDAVRAIRFAEVVVLLLDAERPAEHQDLTIGELVVDEGRALVIAVNKWDLVADKQHRLAEIKSKIAGGLAQVPGVAVVPLSALAEKGLDKLMQAVLAAEKLWNRRVTTSELNRWLAEALERHAPPAASGRRIKIRYMTQPSARPPAFIAFCSRPASLPQSYVKYLTNSLREAFALPGVPLRFSLRKGDNPYQNKGPGKREGRRPRRSGRR